MRDGDTQKGGPFTFEGDVYFDGAGTGLQFAEIYYMGAGFDTVLAAQDTYYQMLGFDSNGQANGAIPDHTNDHITIAKTGIYTVSISISSRSAAATEYQFMVKVNNGTADRMNVMSHRVTSVAGRVGTGACTGLCALTAADTVELWVQRLDGGAVAKTLTAEHIVVNIVQIGG